MKVSSLLSRMILIMSLNKELTTSKINTVMHIRQSIMIYKKRSRLGTF